MTAKKTSAVSLEEIRKYIPQVMASYQAIEGWRLSERVAILAGADYYLGPQKQFDAKVRRQAMLLADDGQLVKLGRGEPKPAGSPGTDDDVTYYTPEKYGECLEADVRARAARAAEVERLSLVRMALARHGFTPRTMDSFPVDEWEALVGLIQIQAR